MIRSLLAYMTRFRLGSAILVLLIPGIHLKRWLALAGFGTIAVVLGVLFAFEISLAPRFHSLAGTVTLKFAPTAIRSGVFIGLGALFAGSALVKLLMSLGSARGLRRHWSLLDSLYVGRVLSGGPRVVVIGGGSGLPNLLRGLKHYTSNLTAVVTVADDGGSSGRLRSELDILPPGDIRNCLVALADSETVMQELMDYRFSTNGQLDGHSFGNILIAALASIGGDFYKGVEIAGQLLAIRGKVIPSTTTNVTLVASTVSGQRLVGESRVGASSEDLRMVALFPPDAPAHPDAQKAIEEADLIILGPGSLFTSIVPNLLVRDIARAVANASGLKMYVCNVAGEAGESAGFSLRDHVDVIRYYAGDYSVDMVIANNNLIEDIPDTITLIDPGQAWQDPAVRILADIIDENSPTHHEPKKLAETITQTYRQHRGKRRRLPLLWHNVQTPVQFNGGEPVGANHQSN